MHKQAEQRGRKRADTYVLLALAGLIMLYGFDAVSASRSIYNLIFIVPVTVVVLLLCLVQYLKEGTIPAQPTQPREPVGDVLPTMCLFGAYVLSLAWLGFDFGTLLFVAGFLWVHGERRWPWLVGYSFALACILALFFSKMLPYPMPMLVIGTAY